MPPGAAHMCLLLIAIDTAPGCPLLLLGNRDEFHGRASAPARRWSEDGRIVGGRDLVAGGSWLALREDGCFAAVTNLRTGIPATAPRSRGWLVRDFLLGEQPATKFLERVQGDSAEYGPFNLVVGDAAGVLALGSGDGHIQSLAAGIHVVSNGAIGVRWPKTERLRARFVAALETQPGAVDEVALLDLLGDEAQPADAALPDTGVGLELERRLAPVFIRGHRYGTRAGSLVARRTDRSLILRERSFGPDAVAQGEVCWLRSGPRGFAQTRSA